MGATNQDRRLTTSAETSGVVPLPRIHRAMPEGERSVPNAVAGLENASSASKTQACLNPKCPARQPEGQDDAEGAGPPPKPAQTGYCTWPKRGRPGYFCSGLCREQYEYERSQLSLDVRALEEALETPGGTYRDRRRVESELAMRRWAMQRYLFDAGALLAPAQKAAGEGEA